MVVNDDYFMVIHKSESGIEHEIVGSVLKIAEISQPIKRFHFEKKCESNDEKDAMAIRKVCAQAEELEKTMEKTAWFQLEIIGNPWKNWRCEWGHLLSG